MENSTAVLDLIGNTPLVELHRFETGPCRIFAKLESENPGGSIKDRIALSMIEAAEKEGKVGPGTTLVEATAGNTGLGLALVAAAKGYKLILVIPDKMSREKVLHLRALGTQVVMTRSDVSKGHPEFYQDMAAGIAQETSNSFFVNQFANPANPVAHETGTGPEILAQMDGDVDAVVVGVGSGGTLTGLGRFFSKHSPKTEMVLADPMGSALAGIVEGRTPGSGSYLIEGIGGSEPPKIVDLSFVKKAYEISDRESFQTARELLKREGILAGSSSGTLLAAALRYCREQTEPKRVVFFVADTGNKYLSKQFSDTWMAEQGFLEREPQGSVADLVARRHDMGETVVVGPSDKLSTAYNRMRSADVSQLPVMDGESLVGLIDESDLLACVLRCSGRFDTEVSTAMVTQLETLQAASPVEDLLAVFEHGHVAVVMDGPRFLGLVTKMDLVNHIRRGHPV